MAKSKIDQLIEKMSSKDMDRLLSKINKTDTCWLWKGFLTRGYGRFYYSNRTHRAHRFVYEIMKEKIPKDLVTDHLCINRSCVNPDHMRIVTTKENVLCGIGLSAINSRKDICKRGHSLTDKNNLVKQIKGRPKVRWCKKCKAISWKKYYDKQFK